MAQTSSLPVSCWLLFVLYTHSSLAHTQSLPPPFSLSSSRFSLSGKWSCVSCRVCEDVGGSIECEQGEEEMYLV
jgi:hypothetical protein